MIELKTKIDRLCALLKNSGEKEYYAAAAFLRQRIYHPDSYVVLLGESCSGKSTIINSFLDQPVLPVSGTPSTGAITEVCVDKNEKQIQYAVINKNATMEKVGLETFRQLSLHPDKDVKRLRLTVPSAKIDMPGMRIFDTPGYGSLVEEHEEVLLDFLPNCDAVIYTVGYRQGIQKDDHDFIRQMMGLLAPNVPVYLIVNRCREGVTREDRRVQEIERAVSAFLGQANLEIILLPSVQSTEDAVVQIPRASELWEKIRADLYSRDRIAQVRLALTNQLNDLVAAVHQEFEIRLDKLKLTADEAKILQEELEKFADRVSGAVDEVICPGFADIKRRLPERISSSRQAIEETVCEKIDGQAVTGKDETVAFVQAHLLPFQTRVETENLQEFIRIELEALDEKVQNYLNQAVIQFQKDIQLRYSSTAKAGAGAAKDFATKTLNASLLKLFAKYGGAGGAGAGMANAASHLLKKIGDLFGHTFSRTTHNTLKHIMSKIGLTSTRVLSGIVAGLIEVVSMAIDAATWKGILKGKVRKGLGKWETECRKTVIEDLDKLEEQNIRTIQEIAEQTRADAKEHGSTGQADDMNTVQVWLAELGEIERGIYK